MGLRIKTNVISLTSQRSLEGATQAASKSMEKLSSGYRINRAVDDAAGMSVSTQMTGTLRSLLKQA